MRSFPVTQTRVTDSGVGKTLAEHLIPELLRNPEPIEDGVLAVGFVGPDDAGGFARFHR